MNARISVLIVTRGRPGLLRACLESIWRCESPLNLEILVVLNGDCPATERWLEGQDRCEVVSCPATSPAGARNFGLAHARGTFVCFLDDDVVVPSHYFRNIHERLLKHPEIDVLGGPDRTFLDAPIAERAVGLALQSPLATGGTRFRHRPGTERELRRCDERQLILCNLLIRRELFEADGHRFHEGFFRNEENVLLHELRHRRLLYDPAIHVYHRRKSRPSHLFAAALKSGYFRAKSFVLFPDSARLEYGLPAVFLLYLAILPALPAGIGHLPLAVYAAVNLACSLRLSWGERRLDLVPLVVFYQALLNVAYGSGFLIGLTKSVLSAFAFSAGSWLKRIS